MKLGIFVEETGGAGGNATGKGNSTADSYDRLLELAAVAEELGFASLWLAAQDFALASAVAEQSEYLRVGVLSNPALEHPVKIAEDAAVLDLLSNGRLLFGARADASPEELAAASIAPGQRQARFEEAMDLIVKAWTHDGFAYLGEYNRVPLLTKVVAEQGQAFVPEPVEPPFLLPWKRAGLPFDYLSLQPKPVQQPRPPVFVATGDEDTARWAARRGHSLILDADEAPASDAASVSASVSASSLATAYWHELDRVGRGREEVTLALTLTVAAHDGNDTSASATLSGDPEQVLEGIKTLVRNTGAFQLLCRVVAGYDRQAEAIRSLQLLASDVRPRLEM